MSKTKISTRAIQFLLQRCPAYGELSSAEQQAFCRLSSELAKAPTAMIGTAQKTDLMLQKSSASVEANTLSSDLYDDDAVEYRLCSDEDSCTKIIQHYPALALALLKSGTEFLIRSKMQMIELLATVSVLGLEFEVTETVIS